MSCLNLKTIVICVPILLKQMIPLCKEGRCSLGPQISGQTTLWETQICHSQVQVRIIYLTTCNLLTLKTSSLPPRFQRGRDLEERDLERDERRDVFPSQREADRGFHSYRGGGGGEEGGHHRGEGGHRGGGGDEGGLHRRGGEREQQQRHRRERELQTSWTVGREERNRYTPSIWLFCPFKIFTNK